MQSHSHRLQRHVSWHSLSPEKRLFKRYKVPMTQDSRHLLNHPDVYPQDPKQEEDKMSSERLKNGYIIPSIPMEYDSLHKSTRLDRLDEIFLRGTRCLIQITHKKNEQNIIMLDKKKIKEGTFQSFNNLSSSKKDYQKFFEDLAKGKSLQTLTKRFPYFKKKDECMDYIYLCKVPIQKAIWFFKMNQLAYCTMITQNKQKKPTFEQYSIDQTKLFTKYLREFLRKFDGVVQLESLSAYQRWPYFICLYKHSFEEGIVDRYEFLMDICDIAYDYVNFPLEKPQIFRMLIIFLSQFIDVITQNVILSRRVAYIIATRFKIYKRDYDRKRGSLLSNVYSSECFIDLMNCQHHRAVIMTMLGILHAIIIDCPVSLIWNLFDSEPLCGSPLDLLPCSPDAFLKHLPQSAFKIDDILRFRITEIKRRSKNVENRWSLNPNSHSGFELIVDVCLNVLSILDKAVLNSPNALLKLYKNIFCVEANEKVQQDMIIRIRILIQWAITTEREGTHRALIVCHLLKMRKRHYRSTAFGSYSFQDILIDYLNKEGPVPSNPNFFKEFANLMFLFYELQRFNLFSHDAYVRALMRSGQLSFQDPIFKRLRKFNNSSESTNNFSNIQLSTANSLIQSDNVNIGTIKQEINTLVDSSIISFNPTTLTNANFITSSSSLSSNFCSSTSSSSSVFSGLPFTNSSLMLINSENSTSTKTSSSNNSKEFASLLPINSIDDHIFMKNPAEMTVHERFFIHLPIEQSIAQRDLCNQRIILLYGICEERDNARQELRKIALQICKIWQKKINVEFFYNSKEVRFKKRINQEQIFESLSKFKCLTYYDQLVICGWCSESFVEMIQDFIQCNSLLLPTAECLDIICYMMETCQNFNGIILLSVKLFSQFILLENILSSFDSDCIPGTISRQLAFVLVGYLAENFYYFLYSKEAPLIINGLYRIIEKELCAKGYPVTGWARTISAFILHAKNELLNANLCSSNLLLGSVEIFQKLFPESGVDKSPRELKYNNRLFLDFLQQPRFYSYHDYKLRLPSIEDAHTQYSFVVNAFLVAKNLNHDFAMLSELSNICSHISAEKLLAGEWCVAIQELCYSKVSKNGYSHLISEINVDDPTVHYSISTFIMLLASKYCFSTHALLKRLLNNVFLSFIKFDSSNFDGSEMGLCLALVIVSSIVCGTDIPFLLNYDIDNVNSSSNNQSSFNLNNIKKYFEKNADKRAIKVIQIRELDSCIFQILSAVCILTDSVKRRLNASNGTNYRLKRLQDVLKCSFLAMCEQEWVINRIFRICETTDMESFNSNGLKHNSIGQQLLRISLRRKSERATKQQLMVCNGNSKKSLLDKLLSEMSFWNIRATYYDLKLMIKEISPDGTQKHVQQQAIAADALICEIGKCCRDLFLNCRREDYHKMAQPTQSINAFRFHHINCYWLISPLINVCPKPENIPQSFSGPVTVKAKFLKEAAAMLDTNHENSRKRLKQSARLLSQKPFLNLILTCIKGEELDNLVNSLLKHIQAIINKAKENPTLLYQSSFALEREGLLLRINLIGGIFDSLLASYSTSEPWALILFQLMFYEIISSDRDKLNFCLQTYLMNFFREYFDICYDMLSTLIHSMMTTSSSQAQSDPDKRVESKNRYPPYNSFVKKIKKELGDRSIPSYLNCLSQLMPILKSAAEFNAWDSFSSNSPQKNTSVVSKISSSQQNLAVRLDRFPHFLQRQLIRLLYHTHYSNLIRSVIGNEKNIYSEIFLAPPVLERVSTELYMSPLLQTQLFHPRCSDSQSWSSVVSLSNQQRILPVSGNSMHISENLSQTALGTLVDQKNNLIFPSVASTSTVNNSANIPQQHQLFNVDADKIQEISTSSDNCMIQIGTSMSFDSSQKNLQSHLQQSSNLPIVQGNSSKSDCLQQQLMTGVVHCSQPSISQQNLTVISSADSNFKTQLQSVSMMPQQSNESFQHIQQGQTSAKMLTENLPQQSIMQGRMYGTGVNSSVKNIVGLSGIGTSGGQVGIHHTSNTNATGFLSDRSRSGSSTPTTSTINESSFTATGTGGRGGRRKNTTSNSFSSTARGQKRKKDQRTTQNQPQQPIIISQGGQISSLGMQTDNMGILGVVHGSGGMDMNTISTPLQQIQQQQMHNVNMQNVSTVSGMTQSQIFQQQQQFLAWQQMQQQQNPQQQQFFQHQQLQRSKKQQIQHQQSVMHPNSGNLGGLNAGSNNMSFKADWCNIGVAGPNSVTGNMSSQMSNSIINSISNTGSGTIMQQSSNSGLGLSSVANSHIKDESKHNLQLKILQRMNQQNQQHMQNQIQNSM